MLLSWANVAFYQQLMDGHARGHRRGPVCGLGDGDEEARFGRSGGVRPLTSNVSHLATTAGVRGLTPLPVTACLPRPLVRFAVPGQCG